tara:strand:- start:4404 stop:4586 length:183 start_codon:yes stop_codon:yes gene_type:complete
MNICLDTKLSFFSGSTLTLFMTAPMMDLWGTLLIGLVGGFGGVLGKHLFYKLKDLYNKHK